MGDHSTLQRPDTHRFEQQSAFTEHTPRVGTHAWHVPEPASALVMQWVLQHSLSAAHVAPIARHAPPHRRPASPLASQRAEQQSDAAEQVVPSLWQAVHAPPTQRPEQHWAPAEQVVALPVWMQLAHFASSHTSPSQHDDPPSAPQAPPDPAQDPHWPAMHIPLQHCASDEHAPLARHV
jgi:hypothetical protein